MKKSALTAVLCTALAITASAAELEKWTFSSENDVKKVQNYFNSKNNCRIAQRFDAEMKPSKNSKGSYCFEILQRGRIFADITPIFPTKCELKKGKNYTLSIMMRADRNLNFRCNIAKNYPGWESAYEYPCKLVKDRWQKITFQFQPKFDLPGKGRTNRVPVLYLGDAPTGTRIWVASIVLSDDEEAPVKK